MSWKTLKYWMPAILIETGLASLLVLEPVALRVVETIAILLATSAVYIISVGLVLKKNQSAPNRYPMPFILGFALLFRMTVWPLSPGFTDDLFRYRWEARAQKAGLNPYVVTPNDPRTAALEDETFAKIPGREYRAVYGPLAELTYRFAYLPVSRFVTDPWRQVFWLKLPSAIFELGVLAGIWAMIRAARLPSDRMLIYAWSPLPVFEFWGNGHNDTLMLCALVWAFWAAERNLGKTAFSLLGAAAAVKLWPAVLLPVFAVRRGLKPERLLEAVMLPAVVVSSLLPFGYGILTNLPFVSGFLGGWRNNDSFYGFLLWITGDLYLAKYCAFGILLIAAVALSFSSLSRTKASLALISIMLLVSANCHPWYLSWILVLLPLHPSLALLTWAALVPLAYQALPEWIVLGEWNGSTPLRWFVYIPVFSLLAWEFFPSRGEAKPKKSCPA